MDEITASQMIAFEEAKGEVERNKDEGIKVRLREAMKRTYRHWLITDENQQFLVAVAAVSHFGTPEEQESIKVEVEAMKQLNAILTAPGGVDLSRLAAIAEEQEGKPISA